MKSARDFLKIEFWDEATPWLSVAPGTEPDSTLVEFLQTHPETKNRGLLGFQTSGSSGAPKWVMLEKSAFLASARAVNSHLRATSADRWLIPLPTHHVAGFAILARCYLSGASFEKFEAAWDAKAFVDQVEEEACTLCSLVPTQVYDLVKFKLQPPPGLRAVLVGGGGMNAALREAAIQLGWPLLQTFGMTEASSGIATESLEEGFPVQEAPLEILPIWNLKVSEAKTLVVQGAALAKGYVLRESQGWNWQAIPSDGLVTRDHVELLQHDGRNCLKFLGRDSAFIKVKGELLHLGAIQSRWEVLAMANAFRGDAVILSMPDERRDEKLVLAVAAGTDPSELERLLALYHAQSPSVEKIHETRWIDAIPRSDLGKVKLEALRVKCR